MPKRTQQTEFDHNAPKLKGVKRTWKEKRDQVKADKASPIIKRGLSSINKRKRATKLMVVVSNLPPDPSSQYELKRLLKKCKVVKILFDTPRSALIRMLYPRSVSKATKLNSTKIGRYRISVLQREISKTILVSNFLKSNTEEQLVEFFSKCGPIKNVRMQDQKALISFEQQEHADAALDLSGSKLTPDGRLLRVQPSFGKDQYKESRENDDKEVEIKNYPFLEEVDDGTGAWRGEEKIFTDYMKEEEERLNLKNQKTSEIHAKKREERIEMKKLKKEANAKKMEEMLKKVKEAKEKRRLIKMENGVDSDDSDDEEKRVKRNSATSFTKKSSKKDSNSDSDSSSESEKEEKKSKKDKSKKKSSKDDSDSDSDSESESEQEEKKKSKKDKTKKSKKYTADSDSDSSSESEQEEKKKSKKDKKEKTKKSKKNTADSDSESEKDKKKKRKRSRSDSDSEQEKKKKKYSGAESSSDSSDSEPEKKKKKK